MDDLALGLRMYDSILSFWNFFVPGAIAITGWVFASEDRWPLAKRLGKLWPIRLRTPKNLSSVQSEPFFVLCPSIESELA
jgi:hypothetical protein